MKRIGGILLIAGLLSGCNSMQMTMSPPSDDKLAGTWLVCRGVENGRIEMAPGFFVLEENGGWSVPQPTGESARVGFFDINGAEVEFVRVIERDEDAFGGNKTMKMTLEDYDTLKGAGFDGELHRYNFSVEEITAQLPGEWIVLKRNNDELLDAAPYYFKLREDGKWESVVTVAGLGLKPQSGSYHVDTTGFVVLTDDDDKGSDYSFIFDGERLHGALSNPDDLCEKRVQIQKGN